MGHYCRICGRARANEKFTGKGHKIMFVKIVPVNLVKKQKGAALVKTILPGAKFKGSKRRNVSSW